MPTILGKELFSAVAYACCVGTLVVPSFVDVPINVAMVATAFFGIVVGSYKSLAVVSRSLRQTICASGPTQDSHMAPK